MRFWFSSSVSFNGSLLNGVYDCVVGADDIDADILAQVSVDGILNAANPEEELKDILLWYSKETNAETKSKLLEILSGVYSKGKTDSKLQELIETSSVWSDIKKTPAASSATSGASASGQSSAELAKVVAKLPGLGTAAELDASINAVAKKAGGTADQIQIRTDNIRANLAAILSNPEYNGKIEAFLNAGGSMEALLELCSSSETTKTEDVVKLIDAEIMSLVLV